MTIADQLGSRIPHGFHEHEMRAYFSQFGTVNHVRLSRSKKTGRSKHYAFLEFNSVEVAKIVAATMNNYLLFGHILKCALVPKEQVSPNLWKGADRRFKAVPWNKIEGRKIALPKGRTAWDKKVAAEAKKRDAVAEKTKALGYEYKGPELKGTETVPVRKRKVDAVEESVEVEKTLVVDGGKGSGQVIVSEQVTTKKVRKSAKKGKAEGNSDDVVDKVKEIMADAADTVEKTHGEASTVAVKAADVASEAAEKVGELAVEAGAEGKRSKRARKSAA